MSEEIRCYVCGHSINEHGISGCLLPGHSEEGYCVCELTASDIAAYAIAQAYEQGRIDYGGGDVDRFLIFAKTCNTDAAHIAKAGQP